MSRKHNPVRDEFFSMRYSATERMEIKRAAAIVSKERSTWVKPGQLFREVGMRAIRAILARHAARA